MSPMIAAACGANACMNSGSELKYRYPIIDVRRRLSGHRAGDALVGLPREQGGAAFSAIMGMCFWT